MGASRLHRFGGTLAAIVAVVAVGSAGSAALALRWRGSPAGPVGPLERSPFDRAEWPLRVPHMSAAIVLDSDTDDPGWTSGPGPARTGPFVSAHGAASRPYSDARIVWGDDTLYLALYAADEDIESFAAGADGPVWLGDSFRLLFWSDDQEFSIEVSPTGTVTDSIRRRGGALDYSWQSGAHVSHEIDGTLNDPSDDDEEWVIEMAIPFASLGRRGRAGETLGFAASRCDRPKHEDRVCAGWGAAEGGSRATLVLDP